VEEICDAALQHREGDCSAFLAAACGGDEVLRQEVDALLVHAQLVEQARSADTH
jgi:hypothetical protein